MHLFIVKTPRPFIDILKTKRLMLISRRLNTSNFSLISQSIGGKKLLGMNLDLNVYFEIANFENIIGHETALD